MQLYQRKFRNLHGLNKLPLTNCSLVLAFGAKHLLNEANIKDVASICPQADIISCSTSGEIMYDAVCDDELVLTFIQFNQPCHHVKVININDYQNSFVAGEELAALALTSKTKHLMIFADGSLVNGSELVRGINEVVPKTIGISGGLAGDGTTFSDTLVGLNNNIRHGNIVVVEFYGDNIEVSTGCAGGWKPFGPYRTITRSENNVLYELDGTPALHLYKKYLNEKACELPGSALLFPLAIGTIDEEQLVRTILSINEETGSMTFAGNMPQGATARLMMASAEQLIDAADVAAANALKGFSGIKTSLAILVSCVGRKIVLKNRVEEEVENVLDIIGHQVTTSGFYSYGEISPFRNGSISQFHNQTMAVTLIGEYE